jgi:hypothetical protein
MSNPHKNGWLAEQERGDMNALFGCPGGNLHVVSEADAMTKIRESAQRPVTSHPWVMADVLFQTHEIPYSRLTTFNQDANNCAGHAASKAIDAFMLISKWIRSRRELSPFETYVPWIWGVGKNEAGQTGLGGATIGAMLAMVTKHGVLPTDTPGLPPYKGTSDKWAAKFGKGATGAPYSRFWPEAKQYLITAAQLPQDDEAFYLACKAGYAVAFGTNREIELSGSGHNRVWSVKRGWMHAMAAYGYNEELDAVGIDNSHGDGFGWANRKVLEAVVTNAKYFDAFVILDITPRQGKQDWNTIGRN